MAKLIAGIDAHRQAHIMKMLPRHSRATQRESVERTRRFAAFDNRNFRRYYVGQTVSSIGSWSNTLAVTWLVLELTNRSDQLGIAMALQFLPLLVLGAPAGTPRPTWS